MLSLENVTRINGLVQQITSKLAFIAPLATRLVIGLAFYQAGSGKFRHFENVVGFFPISLSPFLPFSPSPPDRRGNSTGGRDGNPHSQFVIPNS